MKINKKKIACLALASALVIPGVMGLAGCEKGHTHAFNSDPFYEVITEDGKKIARSWRECSCGADNMHKKVENAIIVSANQEDDNYIQKVLDKDINGKTIVFDAGIYNDIMEIRPSYDTAVVHECPSFAEIGNEVSKDNLDANTKYAYLRDITNVNFVGTENAVLKNKIYMRTGPNGNGDRFFPTKYDAVKKTNCTQSIAYRAIMNFTNISFERLNFETKAAQIFAFFIDSTASYKGLTIQSCKWTNNENYTEEDLTEGGGSDGAAIFLSTGNPFFHINNIKVYNNNINGYYQGVYISNCNTVNIENNIIKTTVHNGIALQTGYSSNNDTDYSVTGDMVIRNNAISNTGDRAIRFGVVNKANVLIENNSFINAKDADSELLKTQIMINSSYKFINNMVDGKLINDIQGENHAETTTPWKIIIQ